MIPINTLLAGYHFNKNNTLCRLIWDLLHSPKPIMFFILILFSSKHFHPFRFSLFNFCPKPQVLCLSLISPLSLQLLAMAFCFPIGWILQSQVSCPSFISPLLFCLLAIAFCFLLGRIPSSTSPLFVSHLSTLTLASVDGLLLYVRTYLFKLYIFNSCLQLLMWFCDSLPYYYKHRLNSWKDELDLKINKLVGVHDLASIHSPLNYQQWN